MNRWNATPAKLRNGTWGARVNAPRHDVDEDDQLTVTTRAGKTWTAWVDRVIWGNDEITLVSTRRNQLTGYGHVAVHNGRIDARKVAAQTPTPAPAKPRGRLVGTHGTMHCGCGNWSGAGSPCLYSYEEAKEAGEAHVIRWQRKY